MDLSVDVGERTDIYLTFSDGQYRASHGILRVLSTVEVSNGDRFRVLL